MGKECWSKRPLPCTLETCKDYAAAARSLEGFQGNLKLAMGRMTGNAWRSLAGDGRFGYRVAHEIGIRIPLPTPMNQAFAQTALMLRALGILCCVASNRPMEECDCLFDWGKGFAEDELKGRLEQMARSGIWSVAS
jgi:hypothetical protein